MSSLMDMLLSQPSAADKFMSLAPMMDGGGGAAATPAVISGGTSMNAGHWQDVAQRMATQKGYSPQDWDALNNIIQRESGWDPNAVNASSGAYGIPQILPASHPDAQLQNDPRGQLKWLFQYINGRYGSPEAAWQFKQDQGWY